MSSEPVDNKGVDSKEPKRSSGVPWFAVILIVLGLILLLQQVGDFSFDNWWALFILIPFLSACASAVAIWRRAGRFTFAVWSTFYGGLFPLLVAAMFLFNLDWEEYWPLFIILGGFGMMVGGLPFRRPGDERAPPALLCHRAWPVFIGLSGVLLGASFLALNLDLIESLPFIEFENWWGIFIIIAALGGVITALLLLLGRHSVLLAVLNLAAAALVVFTGVVALYSLDWNLISVAAAGIVILVGLGLIVGVGGRRGGQGSDME
jgi:hypothetical protein